MWRLQEGRAMSETRKIAAILVGDVVGYSRLAGADEDRILARLRALRSDLIDPTIAVPRCRAPSRDSSVCGSHRNGRAPRRYRHPYSTPGFDRYWARSGHRR